MERKRSIGITLFGTFALILGLVMLTVSSRMMMYHLTLYTTVYVIASLSFIGSGIFMFKRKNWARRLFLVLLTINVFTGTQGYYFGLLLVKSLFVYLIFSFSPFVLSLYYLTRPRVKEQFK